MVGYLASPRTKAHATLRCVGGCSCERGFLDAHHEGTSVMREARLRAASRETPIFLAAGGSAVATASPVGSAWCLLEITTLDDERLKILSLSVGV